MRPCLESASALFLPLALLNLNETNLENLEAQGQWQTMVASTDRVLSSLPVPDSANFKRTLELRLVLAPWHWHPSEKQIVRSL